MTDFANIRKSVADLYGLDKSSADKINAALKLWKLQGDPSNIQNSVIDGTALDIFADQSSDFGVEQLSSAEIEQLGAPFILETRHVESNAQRAFELCQLALASRVRLRESGRLQFDAMTRLNDFFATQSVHFAEITDDCYDQSVIDAEKEKLALDKSISDSQYARNEYLRMRGAEVSDAVIAGVANASGQLAQLPTPAPYKQDAFNLASGIATYGGGKDKLGWVLALSQIDSTIDACGIRSERAKDRAVYFKKDRYNRLMRTLIASQNSQWQLVAHSRIDGVVNFKQAFVENRLEFSEALRGALYACRVVQEGTDAYYGIDLGLLSDVEAVGPGQLLDYLVRWITASRLTIATNRARNPLTLKTVSVRGARTSADFLAQISSVAGISVGIVVGEIFEAGDLLRGVCVEFTGAALGPFGLSITPPQGATIGGVDRLIFGRVPCFSTGEGVSPQFSDATWNGAIAGEWIVRAIPGLAMAHADDVLLHFYLTSQ